MSMHRIPLTEIEEAGLKAHGLDIGTPSQLSDAFRQGVAWATDALAQENKRLVEAFSTVAASLRKVGADIPAPQNLGAIEGAQVAGLSIALLLIEDALATVKEKP